MASERECNFYYEDSPDFLVQYRGNFKQEIDKISYACGSIINETIGVVSLQEDKIEQLLKDVPSIIYFSRRRMFVLQDISPASVDNVNTLKINPYMNLNGSGVLIGMVDTGIDYLNQEFINEDGTTRISAIWDQSIKADNETRVYMGEIYSREQINNAINAAKNNQDPYKLVPSKDEIGHGTNVAGIIGARGKNSEFESIAPNAEFVVVKLMESINYRNITMKNGVPYTPIYNESEILAAIEFIKNYAISVKKPVVIYVGVGTTQGAHDGAGVLSKYITKVGNIRGVVTVIGVGNEGAAEGHVSGVISTVGESSKVELVIPRDIKSLSFGIWSLKPNRMSVSVASPTGEASNIILAKNGKEEKIHYVFVDTDITVKYYDPDFFTGHELIYITFENIRSGVWVITLVGEYITDGRYHIWLPPQKTLPEGTKFSNPDPTITLTVPSTARKVVTVAYTMGFENIIVGSSGQGFNSNALINPDITTVGINILTTKVGGGVTTFSGSSAATAIIVGACALILQWGIVQKNNLTMNSIMIRSFLIYGANRDNTIYKYPNTQIGYGIFDLLETFNHISSGYREQTNSNNNFVEYYVEKLFIRMPKEIMEDIE